MSARTASHATHAVPFAPQVAAVFGLQVAPAQHPVGQAAAHELQAPLVQLSPPGQLWHWEPAAPHAEAVVPVWQLVPAQQPAHDVPSHTHAPPAHR